MLTKSDFEFFKQQLYFFCTYYFSLKVWYDFHELFTLFFKKDEKLNAEFPNILPGRTRLTTSAVFSPELKIIRDKVPIPYWHVMSEQCWIWVGELISLGSKHSIFFSQILQCQEKSYPAWEYSVWRIKMETHVRVRSSSGFTGSYRRTDIIVKFLLSAPNIYILSNYKHEMCWIKNLWLELSRTCEPCVNVYLRFNIGWIDVERYPGSPGSPGATGCSAGT